MAAITGISYSEILQKIITATEQRLEFNTKNKTSL